MDNTSIGDFALPRECPSRKIIRNEPKRMSEYLCKANEKESIIERKCPVYKYTGVYTR